MWISGVVSLLLLFGDLPHFVSARATKTNSADAQDKSHVRRTRYLGLSKRYKLNRRYQECVGPGDVQGHCKHLVFCPMDVLGSSKVALDYLCIIEKTHVGVCCPDDIILSGLTGSLLVMDLPAGGLDYDETEDNATGCGLSDVIGGSKPPKDPSIQRWPWIASLRRTVSGQIQLFCGGAVITDQHILTAAHCTNGLTAAEIFVRLGEYDYRKPDETRYRDFRVKYVTEHEEFQSATYENDIAILQLEKPVAFDSYVWPICLPPKNEDLEGVTAVVAGWGRKYYGGPTSEVLLQVKVPVWQQDKCNDAFLQRITEKNLCAAAYEGGKDSCLGDSGGPLLYQLPNGRWVTIGIVSWGIGCGDKGKPGIYTRVDKYLPWIIKNTIGK